MNASVWLHSDIFSLGKSSDEDAANNSDDNDDQIRKDDTISNFFQKAETVCLFVF